MPSTDSPEVIVARWLYQNRYEKTLTSFLEEAGLPPDAGTITENVLTLERVLEEKRLYDQSVSYEKRSDSTQQTWTLPACSGYQILDIPQASNILHVSVDQIFRDNDSKQLLSITMADRRLMQTDATGDMEDVEHIITQDSPILSWTSISNGGTQFLGTTMSGKVFLDALDEGETRLEALNHKRYCVKAVIDQTGWRLASIGWDSTLNIYQLTPSVDDKGISSIAGLGDPVSTLSLSSIPEDIIWIDDPRRTASDHDTGKILLLTRRDSCLLHYYAPTEPTPTSLGTQNLAPHAISWTIFTPSSIAICPTDPSLLAVATSSLPHLKLMFVKIQIPHAFTPEQPDSRTALEKANADESSILHHVSTLAPQTPYSTPKVVWRPDGSGVWVNGDNGCVRGIEKATGKIIETLKGGHEVATKVRTLWAGYVHKTTSSGPLREEWVVSGGFDRRVVVWKISTDETK